MLPTVRVGDGMALKASTSSNFFLSTYFRRLTRPTQMDFEYTFWLMTQLCISPKTAYRHVLYNRQTKKYWARDDPAFVVICCQLVAAAALAYCIMYSKSLWQAVVLTFSAVLVHFLLLGALVATICWFITNNYLLKQQPGGSQMPQQVVEWMYAFDVHCNAYLPLLLLLYVLQLLLSPLLLAHSFLCSSLSVTLYAGALAYYHYLIFLGYSCLPFLERTEVFLWPAGLMLLLWPFVMLSGFNPTRFALSMYFGT